ncbi:MAG: A24 family peptidase [Polyangia bacterium]|jgi:Flp pilus assembly protein protease CpaA|nr:A24 family peptidase [Polyangia bacterium]
MIAEPSPLLHAALAVLGLAAAILDLRTRLLPDWLTLGGMAVGLVLGLAVGGWDGLVSAFVGMVAGLAVFWLLCSLGMMGGGDVLLMGAMGALLGWPMAVMGLVYSALVGALLGLAVSAARGNLLRVFRNLWAALSSIFRPKKPRVRLADLPTDELPYAVAIAIGSGWAALTAYVPAVALL